MRDLDGRLVVAALVVLIVVLVVVHHYEAISLSWLISGGAVAVSAAFSAYQIFGPDDTVLHFGRAPAPAVKPATWPNPSWLPPAPASVHVAHRI